MSYNLVTASSLAVLLRGRSAFRSAARVNEAKTQKAFDDATYDLQQDVEMLCEALQNGAASAGSRHEAVIQHRSKG